MTEDRFPKKTLGDLDWHGLLEHLARRATGEEAAERCRELGFPPEEQAADRREMVGELLACLEADDPPPALPAHRIGDELARIRGDASVSGEALLLVAADLKLFGAVARYLENRRDTCPRTAAAILEPLDKVRVSPISAARLAAEIEGCFEPDGTLSDGASPELGRLRQRASSLRRNLLDAVEEIAEQQRDVLQERTITLRNDRYVLPVRADAHRRFPGIVHGGSGSGATIFVEPESAVELGNQLTIAREEVAREEARVLARLRGAVREELAEVRRACEAVIEADVLAATARLARDLEAAAPGETPAGSLELRRARHPLLVLEGAEAVPSTLELEGGSCLLISGPNAGGKTVTLKTAGLLGLMHCAGMPIPASVESRLGSLRRVLTDIGDDQSIERSLSTFSAHMQNTGAVLRAAGPGCLVLLDELADGTDPAEGAALAEAILVELLEHGATVLATTHSDVLKSRAQDLPGFSNAAMGFDVDAGRPTFELCSGFPGSSDALVTAERYGIPPRVVERARQLLPEGRRELVSAVESLERERRSLELERRELQGLRASLDRTEMHKRQELATLRQRQDRFVDEEARRLHADIRRARDSIREAQRAVRRRKVNVETVERARERVAEVDTRTSPGGDLSAVRQDDLPGEPARGDRLEPGDPVWVPSLRAEGVVEESPRGGRVRVRSDALRLQVDLDGLRALPRRTGAEKRPGRGGGGPTSPRPASEKREAIRTADNTLDLRGKTVDEALAEVDAFLDKALRDDAPAVFLIHGHGTGALRDAVRGYLETSAYAESQRPGEPEEGGDGVTVARLV